jgi:TonB family protein
MLAVVVPFLIAVLATGQSSRSTAQQLQNVHQGGGTQMPAVRKDALPQYPADAVAAGIQGVVELEVVVGTDGKVIHARIAKSLDDKLGLDREALAAAGEWVFRPAVDGGGRPLTVLVGLQLTFGLSGQTPRVSARITELPHQPLAPPSPGMPQPDLFTDKAPGFVNPKTVRAVQPEYTSAAMRAKIMGTVGVSIVILADGTVGETRLVKSLDPDLGLDQAALVAARYWIFEPATLNGRPVATRATLELEFRLH